jgi:hypothetical protein
MADKDGKGGEPPQATLTESYRRDSKRIDWDNVLNLAAGGLAGAAAANNAGNVADEVAEINWTLVLGIVGLGIGVGFLATRR